MIKKGFLTKLLIVIIAILYILSLVNAKIIRTNIDFSIIFSFIIIAIICILQIRKDEKNFSLNKTFWYFNLFFMFLAPLINYISDFKMWNYDLNSHIYFKTNLLLIFSYILYIIFSKLKIIYRGKKTYDKINKDKISNKTICLFIILSIISFLLISKIVGFSNLFVKSLNDVSISDEAFINNFVRYVCCAIPVYTFTIILYKKRIEHNRINFYYAVQGILLFFIVTLNFPTSTTRFWMGAIYIGLFLIVMYPKIAKRTYDLLIICTFALIFPVMFSFKYITIYEFSFKKIFDNFNFIEAFNSVDYDAYSILGRTLEYTYENDFSYGKQIGGTIFFWVPRSVWNSKPKSSGSVIVASQGQKYQNVSCPFVAEAYIDFGIFGVIFYMFALAQLLKKIDNMYWYNSNGYLINIFYPFLLGFLLFALRGAFHHSVIYTLYFLLPAVLLKVTNSILKGDFK